MNPRSVFHTTARFKDSSIRLATQLGVILVFTLCAGRSLYAQPSINIVGIRDPTTVILKINRSWEEYQNRAGVRANDMYKTMRNRVPSNIDARRGIPNHFEIDMGQALDQGNCGSCTCFASIAALRSEVERIDPAAAAGAMPQYYYDRMIGLPCSGARSGYCLAPLLQDLAGSKPATFSVLSVPGQQKKYKAKNWGLTRNREDMRRILASGRPLVADFSCTPLYSLYSGGVYSEESARKSLLNPAAQLAFPSDFQAILNDYSKTRVNGHAILVVGYVKAGTTYRDLISPAAHHFYSPQVLNYQIRKNYWICLNSYGKDWGQNGKFLIEEQEPHGQKLDPIDDVMYWIEGAELVR